MSEIDGGFNKLRLIYSQYVSNASSDNFKNTFNLFQSKEYVLDMMPICIYFRVFRCIPVCIPVYSGVFGCIPVYSGIFGCIPVFSRTAVGLHSTLPGQRSLYYFRLSKSTKVNEGKSEWVSLKD